MQLYSKLIRPLFFRDLPDPRYVGKHLFQDVLQPAEVIHLANKIIFKLVGFGLHDFFDQLFGGSKVFGLDIAIISLRPKMQGEVVVKAHCGSFQRGLREILFSYLSH